MPARYAVKALFQIRFENESLAAFRTVEERIFLLDAKDAKNAFMSAKTLCKSHEFSTKNDDGIKFFFEFIGILEIIHLGIEVEGEVWYEIRKMKQPMERKGSLVKSYCETSAAKYEKTSRAPS